MKIKWVLCVAFASLQGLARPSSCPAAQVYGVWCAICHVFGSNDMEQRDREREIAEGVEAEATAVATGERNYNSHVLCWCGEMNTGTENT